MRVILTAYSILRDMFPKETGGKMEVELPAGATLRSLLEKLKIPRGAACAVNGTIQRDPDFPLHEGDVVSVFRPGSGGIREIC